MCEISEYPIIRNLKIGLRLDIGKYKESLHNLDITHYSNFSVLRDIYVYIIFWSGNYVNITKIPSIRFLQHSIKHFMSILKIKSSRLKRLFKKKRLLKNISIHNICASGRFKTSRNLKTLRNFLTTEKLNARVKLNQTFFPALFVKFSQGTCIIFQNGKYTVVGCNNHKSVFEIADSICAYMKRL